jgi:hypothetical protein
MMVDELMIPDERKPLTSAGATWRPSCSGALPLLAFVVNLFVPIDDGGALSSMLLTGVALFSLGGEGLRRSAIHCAAD